MVMVAATWGGTPAEQKIASAQKALESKPKSVQAYVDLSMAYARRARETSDINYYAQGEQALKKALELDPSNFGARKVEVWLLLGRHEFAKALDRALDLNKRVPDDVLVYGFLTDAYVELGRYKEAEEATQWMLNLRPGNIPALTRTAYLREIFGDLEGALDAMNMAYTSTSPTETEDRAWILAQIGHLRLMQGRDADAERILQSALALFPNYHYALGNLGKLRMEQKRYAEAVRLFEVRYSAAPHAENLFALAEALDKTGQSERAAEAYAEFEKKSSAESKSADNSNHELAMYYAGPGRNPAEAVRIAKMEFTRRQDVHTLDVYAWALHAAGQHEEARKLMEQALAPGIQDPEMRARAAAIRGSN
jgi:tetratricopeptide (TPR) repeat protein